MTKRILPLVADPWPVQLNRLRFLTETSIFSFQEVLPATDIVGFERIQAVLSWCAAVPQKPVDVALHLLVLGR
jgi:hypothetical protein